MRDRRFARARTTDRAFRIVAGVLGALLIVLVVPFAVSSIVSTDPNQTIHRFHNTAGAVSTLILAAALLVLAWRPSTTAAMQLLVAGAVASIVAGLLGGDLLSGLYFVPGIVVAILLVLDPRRGSVSRLGSLRPSLLALAAVAAVPLVAYALTHAGFQRASLPGDPHADLHHYSGTTATALVLLATLLVAGIAGAGWRVVGWIAAGGFVVFGVFGVAYPMHVGAPGVGWAWAAVLAGIAALALTEVEGRRAPAGGR